MRDRVAELESAVATLSSEVGALRARVASLEAGMPAMATDVTASSIPEVHAEEVQNWLALLGRTLVILGGAYLLRAMTSAEIVSYQVGVALGLLYGAPWLLLAARAGSRHRRLDAFCYGLSTALIGYPLVWEATARFVVFTPVQSALLLGGLTAAAFVLSAVWRLHSLAAIVMCGALGSAAGLAVTTQSWLPYTTLAVGVGLTTLWLGYLHDWILLRWPAAAVVNLMIVILTGRADGMFWPVLLLQLATLVGYLGSFAVRTLAFNRTVIPFEAVQSMAVLGLVLSSVFTLLGNQSAAVSVAAVGVLAVGLLAYATAFAVIERRGALANLFFYTLFASVLVTVGTAVLMPRLCPAVLAAAGALAALAATRRVPVVLCAQATLFVAFAAISSGLLRTTTVALFSPAGQWPGLGGVAWFTLACGLAALAAAPRRDAPLALGTSISRLLLALLVVWTASGAIVHVSAAGLQRTGGWDAGWLGTLRTAVTVAATFAVAYASRRTAWREAGWLTYPLLVGLGLKLVASDLPSGRPVTLFVTLAAYGIALIAAPRALPRSA
jgi:hypothetical protein